MCCMAKYRWWMCIFYFIILLVLNVKKMKEVWKTRILDLQKFTRSNFWQGAHFIQLIQYTQKCDNLHNIVLGKTRFFIPLALLSLFPLSLYLTQIRRRIKFINKHCKLPNVMKIWTNIFLFRCLLGCNADTWLNCVEVWLNPIKSRLKRE